MTLNRLLLLAAIIILLWAALLGFAIVDDPSLTDDYSGWLALGLALGFGSSLA